MLPRSLTQPLAFLSLPSLFPPLSRRPHRPLECRGAEFYGTVIYYSSYMYNRRYVDQPFGNKMLVVVSNGLWIIFPVFFKLIN